MYLYACLYLYMYVLYISISVQHEDKNSYTRLCIQTYLQTVMSCCYTSLYTYNTSLYTNEICLFLHTRYVFLYIVLFTHTICLFIHTSYVSFYIRDTSLYTNVSANSKTFLQVNLYIHAYTLCVYIRRYIYMCIDTHTYIYT